MKTLCGRGFVFAVAICLLSADSQAQTYNPLEHDLKAAPAVIDLEVKDQARERVIPIRVYVPEGKAPGPVILFSHGLGGSREGSAYLGRHWASRGYFAVFLQHPGSDASLWEGLDRGQLVKAAREAANARNLLLRVQDVSAVLDQLEKWKAGEGDLSRMDLEKVGMSGHSFGAVTTQAVSGQLAPGGQRSARDDRIDSAVIMSPSSPRVGSATEAFAKVSIPWMLMTGTNDVSRIVDTDMASRLAVYPALPAGHKYELVLDKGEHYAFTERGAAMRNQPRNPNHHRVILALSTAFWDAYLRDQQDAKEWLDGNGPKSVLEPNDRWQKK